MHFDKHFLISFLKWNRHLNEILCIGIWNRSIERIKCIQGRPKLKENNNENYILSGVSGYPDGMWMKNTRISSRKIEWKIVEFERNDFCIIPNYFFNFNQMKNCSLKDELN